MPPTQTPAVSVILPAHNAGDTVALALQSLLNQTLPNLEIIVIDDGSTDATPQFVRALAKQHPAIQLHSIPHTGIVAALQIGCNLAKAQVLARMDADDIAHPHRLAKQLACLNANPNVALCGTQVAITGHSIGSGRQRYLDWINALVTHHDMTRERFVECPIPHPTFMLRRKPFEDAGGYLDHGWAEDYDLLLRLLLAGHHLAKIPEVLLQWRHSPNRLSARHPDYALAQFRALKRHYLRKSVLANNRPFYQWGAGEVGKLWLREWNPTPPRAAVDINPRKIGRAIHNTPVISPADLPPPGQAFTLVAVGAPGARGEIRQWFTQHHYTEEKDYLFIA